MKIKSIQAREIKDSRGKPTIEVLANSQEFSVKAGVPSGASTGKLEAKVINIPQALKNINEIIGPRLINKDPSEQDKIDDFLIELDGTEDKSNLGANTIIGVSMAIAKLGAQTNDLSLWEHISQLAWSKVEPHVAIRAAEIIMPRACFNIINGGAHAKNDLDIQEFMIVPQNQSFAENFQNAKNIYKSLENSLKENFGKIKIGDEGGFAPPIFLTKEALDLIAQAIRQIDGSLEKTEIILDCAASQFEEDGKYQIEDSIFSREELLDFYSNLISQYPIIALEDPFAENDWQGFQLVYKELDNKITIIGDDLLVTNPKRIKKAAEKTACNGAIIKVNQIGTVSEAIEAVKLAKSFSWKIMVSHRSGETLDDFIADFAVGVGADFIKSGAPAMPERLSKYNRLLQIEQEINNQ